MRCAPFVYTTFRRLRFSTLFPYTTLFRSVGRREDAGEVRQQLTRAEDLPRIDVGTERDGPGAIRDRKSTRLNSSHRCSSYAVFCLTQKKADQIEIDILVQDKSASVVTTEQ